MEIKCVNASESTLEMNKAFWKISSKKTFLILIVLLAFSLFLSVYGAIHSNEFSKNESYYSESNVQILTFNKYSNRHILESIGVVMTLVLIWMLYVQRVKKRLFFRRVEENAKRFLETGNEYTIKINEEVIESISPDLYIKMNWVLFSKYAIYKNYIFVGFREGFSIVGIDRRLLSNDEVDNLFKLLKEKGIQKLK